MEHKGTCDPASGRMAAETLDQIVNVPNSVINWIPTKLARGAFCLCSVARNGRVPPSIRSSRTSGNSPIEDRIVMGEALKKMFNGAAVVMDGQTVGKIVTDRQANATNLRTALAVSIID